MAETDTAERPAISGGNAAAILMLLLEESEAAQVMQALEPSSIQLLGRSMFEASRFDERQIEAALVQFLGAARTMPTLAPKAGPHIEKVLTSALGDEKARNILDAVSPRVEIAALDILKWMDPDAIARVLAAEHPQVGAVILSALDPEVAATALGALDQPAQAELMFRTASLGPVSRDVLGDIEAILGAYAGASKHAATLSMGGRSETARIINKLKKDDGTRILDEVKKRDQAMGQQIEEEMFVFDNLNELDDKNLGIVMRNVDSALLSLALKGAAEALAERILGCMSARAADTIRDDMEERGMVKRAEVEDAQKAIIAIARQLADEGTIMMGGGDDDYV
jgi:flagellar motor switch protein FliG